MTIDQNLVAFFCVMKFSQIFYSDILVGLCTTYVEYHMATQFKKYFNDEFSCVKTLQKALTVYHCFR